MSSVIQYDLFEKKTDYEYFKDEMKLLVEGAIASHNKVRKSLYARDGAQDKRLVELEARLEIIERHLCKSQS